MKDIVMLAPIPDVYDKAVKIVAEQEYENVEVILGTMNEGLKIAKELERQGVKIIVTRGGTYKLLRQNLHIPLVEIKVSAYDIIQSFDQIEDPSERIGLVGYSNVVFGFHVLKKLIPNPVQMVILDSESEIPSIVTKYKDRGIRTFIGDSNVAKVVEGLQCKGIMITSQEESIQVAIQEARRILRAINLEKQMNEHLKAITDFVGDGIISIDNEDRITHFNYMAQTLFNIPEKEVLGKPIETVFKDPDTLSIIRRDQKTVGEMVSEGALKLSLNRIPLLVGQTKAGAVISFQEVQEIQKREFNIRKTLASKGFVAKYTFDKIWYESSIMGKTIATAREYAKYDAPVHIFGESGTGKELFAQSIHNESSKKDGPFLAVNCAALPANLIESEFFGYEEGAFTGARKNGKPGMFELAHNGTLFLDEISEIPMDLQGRLLRVLQEKEVMRVGGGRLIPVDVRIITASNRKLSDMVEKDLFRKDLYYRINVLFLKIPSLRERKEDIPVLARHFIRKYSAIYQKEPLKLEEKVLSLLQGVHYEGNVRELENIIERAVILSSFEALGPLETKSPAKPEEKEYSPEGFKWQGGYQSLKELETWYIEKVFEEHHQNVQRTCEVLGISRSTLWRKLSKHPHDVSD